MKKIKVRRPKYSKLQTSGRGYRNSWADEVTDVVGAVVYDCGIAIIIYIVFCLFKYAIMLDDTCIKRENRATSRREVRHCHPLKGFCGPWHLIGWRL